jgi:hypothetical protein
MNLTTAIAAVIDDTHQQDPGRAHRMTPDQIVDDTREFVTPADIETLQLNGDMNSATALAYRIVIDATPAELDDALART